MTASIDTLPGLERDDFVPGEADIFEELDPRDHRRFAFQTDVDEGLVPSSRLAMPERVSIDIGARNAVGPPTGCREGAARSRHFLPK